MFVAGFFTGLIVSALTILWWFLIQLKKNGF